MCFSISKKETQKLRKNPPKYGWRAYVKYYDNDTYNTRYHNTPLTPGKLFASKGPWSYKSPPFSSFAVSGIYCYKSRLIAKRKVDSFLFNSNSKIVKVKITGKIRFANKDMFTCSSVEISRKACR